MTLPVVEVTICDKEYRITPSFRVVEAIEERVNVHEFNDSLAAGKPYYKDTAWILWAALRYGTEEREVPSYQEVGQWSMYEQMESIKSASRVFVAAINPGESEQVTRKKKQATRQESTSEASESESTSGSQ